MFKIESTLKASVMRRALMASLASFVFLISSCGDSRQNFVFTSDQPQQVADFNVAPAWSRAMEGAIIVSGPRPPVVSRSLFIVSSAMYDAWALYDPIATPSVTDPNLRRPAAEHSNFNKNAAVAYAAFHALQSEFPTYDLDTGAFTSLMSTQGYSTDAALLTSNDLTTPAGIGRAAALAVIASRQNDGSNAEANFADTTSARFPNLYAALNSDDPTLPNSPGMMGFNAAAWVPLRVSLGLIFDPTNPASAIFDNSDPSTFRTQVYLTPHWGNVTPFALSDGAQFRPSPPPQPGSLANYTDSLGNTLPEDTAYNSQVDEVLNITANLTEREKCIAEYWADGPLSSTPPGHWNEIALDVVSKYGYGLDDTVKLLFALNGGILDSSIACWEAKRFYDYIRPISAIRNRYAGQNIPTWGGPGVGTVIRPGQEWIPFQNRTFVTPPFGEYVSGHSTFSASSAEILRSYTGSDSYFDGSSLSDIDFDKDGQPDFVGEFHFQPQSMLIDPTLPAQTVTLRWNTFSEAADEAGLSRIFGGIHFQDGDRRARVLGRQVGSQAFQRASALFNGGPQ